MGARVVPSPWERKFFYFFFRERRNFPKCVENLISQSAGMAELADALDSGSSEGFLHAGSSPVSRTRYRSELFRINEGFGFFVDFYNRILIIGSCI